jgi:transposase
MGLHFQRHRENIRRPEVCAFLRHLSRHLTGPVVLLWDNGQIHKGPQIQAFLERHPRLHVEFLPGYAPELNPDEGVWPQTKGALANGQPKNVDELTRQVTRELGALQASPASLRACIHTSELPLVLRR